MEAGEIAAPLLVVEAQADEEDVALGVDREPGGSDIAAEPPDLAAQVGAQPCVDLGNC